MRDAWRIRPVEWQIAWRHLRVGDTPPWVRLVFLAAAFLLAVGGGFAGWAGTVLAAPAPEPLPGIIDGPALSPEQQAFGTLGGLTLVCGAMLLVFALLARLFNLLATIITFSVLLGCMALVVVLSLMSGLEGVLRDQILAQRAHLLVSASDGNRFADHGPVVARVAETPGVAGASPYLEGEVMLRSGINRQGALLIGIEPDRLRTVSNLADIVREGSYESIDHPEDIPAPDPLSFTADETPFRLRHLREEDGARTLRPRPQVADRDPPPALPIPARSPPPPALPGPPPAPEGEDAGQDGGDEGWEDPLAVLGATGGETGGEGDDDGEDDGGWEDPERALGRLPEPDPRGPEPELDPSEAESSPRLGEGATIDAILIGRELAMELAVHLGADVGIYTPMGRMTPAGRVPGKLAARVGGVFFSGMYEYDRKNVYTRLSRVQAFLHAGDRVSGIEVKLEDPDELLAAKVALEAALAELGRSDLRVQTWQELNRNLFSAMFLEKIAMFVALLFVILVASFGILASNLMSVLEKAKEIAILKAMGASDAAIQRVFVAEGLCVGLLGAGAGILIGLASCWALDNFGLPLNEGLYYMEQLPVVVNPLEIGIVGVAALVIVWLSSLYPARVASRMRPVEGLRQAD
jgi:lipoprotein-releasing system permease protein